MRVRSWPRDWPVGEPVQARMTGHTVVLRAAYGGASHGKLLHVAPRPGSPYRVKVQLRQALDTVLGAHRQESYQFDDHQGMRSMTTRRLPAPIGEPAIRAYETPTGPVWVQLGARDGVPTVFFYSRPGQWSTAPRARLEVLVEDFTPDEDAPAGWDRKDLNRWMDWLGITPA